jgi:FMN phosphatase YigB (HAD superfamily)
MARALDFALASMGARLPDGQAQRLTELYDHLRPFPDAVPALRALSGLGYELAVLSNGTPAMIGNCRGAGRLTPRRQAACSGAGHARCPEVTRRPGRC